MAVAFMPPHYRRGSVCAINWAKVCPAALGIVNIQDEFHYIVNFHVAKIFKPLSLSTWVLNSIE